MKSKILNLCVAMLCSLMIAACGSSPNDGAKKGPVETLVDGGAPALPSAEPMDSPEVTESQERAREEQEALEHQIAAEKLAGDWELKAPAPALPDVPDRILVSIDAKGVVRMRDFLLIKENHDKRFARVVFRKSPLFYRLALEITAKTADPRQQRLFETQQIPLDSETKDRWVLDTSGVGKMLNMDLPSLRLNRVKLDEVERKARQVQYALVGRTLTLVRVGVVEKGTGRYIPQPRDTAVSDTEPTAKVERDSGPQGRRNILVHNSNKITFCSKNRVVFNRSGFSAEAFIGDRILGFYDSEDSWENPNHYYPVFGGRPWIRKGETSFVTSTRHVRINTDGTSTVTLEGAKHYIYRVTAADPNVCK